VMDKDHPEKVEGPGMMEMVCHCQSHLEVPMNWKKLPTELPTLRLRLQYNRKGDIRYLRRRSPIS